MAEGETMNKSRVVSLTFLFWGILACTGSTDSPAVDPVAAQPGRTEMRLKGFVTHPGEIRALVPAVDRLQPQVPATLNTSDS
jgi:hypothetical protein